MSLRADIAIEKREYALAEALLQSIKNSVFIINKKEKYKTDLKQVTDLELKLKLATDATSDNL